MKMQVDKELIKKKINEQEKKEHEEREKKAKANLKVRLMEIYYRLWPKQLIKSGKRRSKKSRGYKGNKRDYKGEWN